MKSLSNGENAEQWSVSAMKKMETWLSNQWGVEEVDAVVDYVG